MLEITAPSFLLASPDPALLASFEALLLASGAHVEVVLSAEAALASMTAPQPPALALLDANLPAMDPSFTLARLLATVRANDACKQLPIVLIADTVSQEWIDRLAEGVIDDLILRAGEQAYWQLRLNMVLRTRRQLRELEALRDAAILNAQMDRLTGIYNRETLLSMLFRETDRVQRMNSPLCLVLFDVDDFGHWNERLGTEICDELLCQIVGRTTRLLRSYDLFGRAGKDEFLVALPGCSPVNAVMLAERIRQDVFASPYHLSGESIRLSACFGIAASQGRSPIVVLREAEQALQSAKVAGPESIQCFSQADFPTPAPVTFLTSTSSDELLAW
ncbi:MAG: diguanylate cyclase [Terracidiphilus sp.]|nr:diguanylate cyclase [Terracidiphilus sp.]